MQLHAQLQARKFPNCRKLAQELEVSEKTIQRDIDFMRYRLELPIEYDPLHFGFVYTEPVANFPTIQVSEGEIVALFVAQKALQQYHGTPFEGPLRAAFKKIGDGLKEKVSFSWSELDSAISFRNVGQSEADLEVFETLSHAVLDSAEIEFRYRKLRGTIAETRRVRPYHLGCVDNQWYLLGFDLSRQQLRTFALPRIREPRRTGARFRRPSDFSIAKFLDSSFGIFEGTGRTTVRIRFQPFAAQLVRENPGKGVRCGKFPTDLSSPQNDSPIFDNTPVRFRCARLRGRNRVKHNAIPPQRVSARQSACLRSRYPAPRLRYHRRISQAA